MRYSSKKGLWAVITLLGGASVLASACGGSGGDDRNGGASGSGNAPGGAGASATAGTAGTSNGTAGTGTGGGSATCDATKQCCATTKCACPYPVGDGTSSALPRLFQGKLASTYNPLRPRRPYDFQINDDQGSRYAYVDVSKLLATQQINKYVGITVVVYGTAQAIPGSKDMVIVAESLQLR